jgi:hypothetical protein
MAYRIEALPRRVKKEVFFRTLLSFLDGDIVELPEGWDIAWVWRNSRKSKLRSDSLENVLAKSRSSFMTLVVKRIKRDLNAIGYTAHRKASKKQVRRAKSWKRRHKSKQKSGKKRSKSRRSAKRRVSKVR